MSDILIKGMEMPEDGFITVTITSDGRVVGNSRKISGKFEYLNNEDIATAVPVPPHGDLIDKKTVSENLASVLNKKNPPFSYPDWNDAIVAMLAAPTIIPVEEGNGDVE